MTSGSPPPELRRRSILLVSPEFGVAEDGTYRPGGVQLFSRLLARAVATSPKLSRLSVWGLLDSQQAMQRTLLPYLESERAPGAKLEVRGFNGSRKRLVLAWLCRRWAFDHAHFLHLGVARAAALTPMLDWSLWIHGIETRLPLRALERWVIRRASPLLSVSAFSRDETQRFNPDLPAATPVHLAVEPDTFWGARTEADLPPPSYRAAERPPAVLIVARLAAAERYKGHDQLIGGWPQVVAAVPGAELLIVGGGDDEARLKQLAASLPETARAKVRFLGRVPHAELLRLYGTSRVFAMPSTGEGFGLVFVEAMRYALPCIAGPDSAAEIVLDGQTGLVVQQTPEAIAQAVITLLTDAALAERFAAAGERRYREQFVFDRFRERCLAAMGLAAVPSPGTPGKG
jgi:phosphatidylinositol alpha-1,6-mannosyltransferase